MNTDSQHIEQQSQPEENGQIERSDDPHLQDDDPEAILPLVDRVFVDEDIPSEVALGIAALLKPEEMIFVLFRLSSYHNFPTDSGKTGKSPLWTIVTGTRLVLFALSGDGQTYAESFDQNTVVEYQNGFGRDALKIANKSLLTGIWEGKRWLFKEAVTLFSLPEYEKYLYLANIYLEKEQPLHAVPFLSESIKLVPTIKSYLLLARIFCQHEKQDEALRILHEAANFTEIASLVQEIRLLFPDRDNLELLLYLAAVAEEKHDWDACLEIYQFLLQKTPDFDLYFLKLGELYNAKQDYTTAIDYYQKFISLRTESELFKKGGFIHWDMSDLKWFSADPDLVKAYFDLGLIHEYELNDLEKAASIYLALLRHAPFYSDAYKHFWIVYQQLSDNPESPIREQPSLHIDAFLQVYNLLVPKNYNSVVTTPKLPQQIRSVADPMAYLPVTYHKLRQRDCEALIHPGEQEYLRRIQTWLTSLVVNEEKSEGIEAYCEQVKESNFPKLFHTITRISDFLDILPPKCFISRGKIGISVRNTAHPFIFIGSEHLNEENERYLAEDELVFIIAAQVEHIKSEHLLITETELWKSLGTASFDSFLVALQCLPAGSFLGRITHTFATAGLKKVYQMTKFSSIQKILDFFDKSAPERSSDEISHKSQDNGKDERSKAKKPTEASAIAKDHLVEFARHAVYSADRVGLLACNHIGTASSVIFKLANNVSDELEKIRHNGLFQVLESKDNRGNFLYCEYAKRFGELIKFALSAEYCQIHSHVVVLPEQVEITSSSTWDTSEYHLLMHKLQILEHSMQNELLTHEEFLRKQKKVLRHSGLLLDDDEQLIDKLQQAFLDEILTLEEFHNKLFQFLETRQEKCLK